MMTGTTQRHDAVTTNLIIALGVRLRGGPCRPTTDDVASRMANGNVRRPDVTVDCGPRRGDALDSSEPVVFFEVLSPSTRKIDFIRKPDEYKRVPTLKHFVVLDPARPYGFVWSRDAEGEWSEVVVEGLEAAIDLPGVALSLPMAEVYEGLELEP
jgi:Uma2 family endonuclease